ncbi:MAG: helix-turn-helix transcriptional regulator [Bdellovibrionota bacterium]
MSSKEAVSIIKKSWQRLRAKDPRAWSLRQVARTVEISPGYLSKIFQKKSPLHWALAKKLLVLLKVDQLGCEVVRASFGKIKKNKFEIPLLKLMN